MILSLESQPNSLPRLSPKVERVSLQLEMRTFAEIEMVRVSPKRARRQREHHLRLLLPCCGGNLAWEGSPGKSCRQCFDKFGELPRGSLLVELEPEITYNRELLRKFVSYHLNYFEPDWTIIERDITTADLLAHLDEAFEQRLTHGEWFIPQPLLQKR